MDLDLRFKSECKSREFETRLEQFRTSDHQVLSSKVRVIYTFPTLRETCIRIYNLYDVIMYNVVDID